MKIKTLPVLDSKVETPNFGYAIKVARLECGLSQIELGEQLGYRSSTALSLIEANGRGVSAKVLNQIAHITKKPVQFFFNH